MIIDELNRHRIILASRSPRRIELLRDLGLRFDVVIREYDESYPGHLDGEEIARHLAARKARSFLNEISAGEIVITADTVVWFNGTVLEKPSGADEAAAMIRKLSGNTHEVITGVTLLSINRERTFSDSTKVTFEELSEEEITYYVSRFSPFDKAGAYGIQEWIGIAACSRIEGSYFNVVGLPVQKVYRELREFVK